MKNDTKKDTTPLLAIETPPETPTAAVIPEQPCECAPPKWPDGTLKDKNVCKSEQQLLSEIHSAQCAPPEETRKSMDQMFAEIYAVLTEQLAVLKSAFIPPTTVSPTPAVNAPVTLRLGIGEVGITDVTEPGERSIPKLVFHPIQKQALGPLESPPELNGVLVAMTFESADSVQGVINWLSSFKATHFQESNPPATG